MNAKGESHLEAGELLAYAEARALPHGARSHLDRCRDCRDAHAEVVLLVERMRTDRWPEPRPELVAGIAAWRRAASVAGAVRVDQARQVRARESRREPSAALRAESAPPTELRFRASALAVDIEIAVAAATRRVTGQAVSRRDEAPPLTVWAECAGFKLAESPVGEHGEFVLEGLPRGELDIVLDVGERRVRLRLPAEPKA